MFTLFMFTLYHASCNANGNAGLSNYTMDLLESSSWPLHIHNAFNMY